MWIAFSIELRELHTYILVGATVQVQILLGFFLPKDPGNMLMRCVSGVKYSTVLK